MVLSLHKWRKRLNFVLLFLALSYVIYMLLGALAVWLQPKERYKAPMGKAVKVIQQAAVEEEGLSMKDRLLFFYRYGE